MKLHKKKWLIRLGLTAGVLGLIFILMVYVFFLGPAWKFSKFEREHAGAAARVAADLRPALQWHDARKTTSTVAARGVGDLNQEIEGLISAGAGTRAGWNLLLEDTFSANRISLVLAAEDFPGASGAGALQCGEVLRRKILEEMAFNASLSQYAKFWDKIRTDSELTTAAARLRPGLDRAAAILERGDWAWPDMSSYDLSDDYLLFDIPAMGAVLRASARGQGALAGRLLENNLRIHILGMLGVNNRPFAGEFAAGQHGLENYLLAVAETGALAADGLERSEALLRGARIDEKQASELRAARAVAIDPYFSTMTPYTDGKTFVRKLQNGLIQLARIGAGTLIKPAAQAWAEGNKDEYMSAVDRLRFMNRIKPNERLDRIVYQGFCFNPGQAQGLNPFNEQLDWLRFLTASARFRGIAGRPPEKIEELAPRYLDRTYLDSMDANWGVLRLPAGNYPREESLTASHGRLPPSFKRAVDLYQIKMERLPTSLTDLREFAKKNAELAAFGIGFTVLRERTIYYHIRRGSYSKKYLEWVASLMRNTAPLRAQSLLARFRPGQEKIQVLSVEAICWEPEAWHPERLELIK